MSSLHVSEDEMREDHPAHDLMYLVTDPKTRLPNCPAMTTMLSRVCGNDREKFGEATRIVGLYMAAAYDKGQHDAARQGDEPEGKIG